MNEITPDSLHILEPRRGRKARADAPSLVKTIRFSPQEWDRLQKAASVNRQRPSDFARDAIVTAAGDCLEPNS